VNDKMGQITLNELETPEACVMKYIVRKIGLNIRIGSPNFNTSTNEWLIPLKALVPSILKLGDSDYKTFIYRFEDLGNATVVKEDNHYKLIDFPKAHDIDDKLLIQFSDLTSKMEKKLLKIGEPKWGRLTLIQVFLRPLYNIINTLLSEGSMSTNMIEENKQKEYLDLLVKQDIVKLSSVERANERSILPSNLLTKIHENMMHISRRLDTNIVAEEIVGMIFSREYDYIHDSMNNRAPSIYIDTTKAYYLNAVRIGSPIPMSTTQLLSKYKIFGRSQRKRLNFNTIVGELVSESMLSKDNNDNITADDDVFREVLPLRDEMMNIAVEV